MIEITKINEIVSRIAIRFNPDNSIYLTKEELETSISISQEFRDFAIKTIGIKE